MQRFSSFLLAIATMSVLLAQTGFAIPSLVIDGAVETNSEGKPTIVAGEVTISDWPPSEPCVLLPYNTPDFFHQSPDLPSYFMKQEKRESNIPGTTEITAANGSDLINMGLGVYKIPQAANAVTLRFRSNIPRPTNAHEDAFLFSSFFPLPLQNCTPEANGSPYGNLNIIARIQYPSEWQLAGPLVAESRGEARLFVHGDTLGFVLSQGWKVEHFRAAGIPVAIYSIDGKQPLRDTLSRALESHTHYFGAFPYRSLALVETTELRSFSAPGVVLFNRPRQVAFSSLQNDFLNWKHWVVSSLIASQWYGSAIRPESNRDEWLLRGLIDFATSKALNVTPERANLINGYENATELITFNYQQTQEFAAALLSKREPWSPLTTTDLHSFDEAAKQNSYLFVKHSVGLRYFNSLLGDLTFAKTLSAYTQDRLFQSITPQDFGSNLFSSPSISNSQRDRLQAFLTSWWTTSGWPDFALLEFRKERINDGQWLSEVRVAQNGELDIPVKIGVFGKRSKFQLAKAFPHRNSPSQSFVITDFEPHRVDVDPSHDLFDSDRFNNSTEATSMQFFPGNARTLKDNAYTTVWVPYVFRRPGEFSSVALQAQAFRYIRGATAIRLEGSPADNSTLYLAKQAFPMGISQATTEVSIVKNYHNEQVAQVSVEKTPLFNSDPRLGISGKARRKRIVGAPISVHESYALGLSASLRQTDPCTLNATSEAEHAPKPASRLFTYERFKGNVLFSCTTRSKFGFETNAFSGVLSSQGAPPDLSFFRANDMGEAKIRVDVANLDRLSRVSALTTDVFLPFSLPLPGNLMILDRNLRFRLFYDFGRGESETSIHTYQAGGYGILLPFGGDVIGTGAFTISKISLFSIPYAKRDDRTVITPRSLLFNFTGEF